MSAGARDPHDDIDKLCDAMAVMIMSLWQNELIQLSADAIDSTNKRLSALKEASAKETIEAGLAVLMRSRVVH